MGLGKTIQSVSTLNHIWKEEGIRGPFMVLAPLSTLSHWLREFEGSAPPTPRATPTPTHA